MVRKEFTQAAVKKASEKQAQPQQTEKGKGWILKDVELARGVGRSRGWPSEMKALGELEVGLTDQGGLF